jgi:hypothetical protein
MLLSLNKADFYILTDKKGVILQLDLHSPTAEIDYGSLTKKLQKRIDYALMEGHITLQDEPAITQGTEDLE